MNNDELKMLMDLKDRNQQLEAEIQSLRQVILAYYQASAIMSEISISLGIQEEKPIAIQRQREEKAASSQILPPAEGNTGLPFPEAGTGKEV